MKKLTLMVLFVGLLMLIYVSMAFASSSEAHVKWLLGIYGELSSDHALVPRAQNVFERVLAAADKRAAQNPELLIISEADDPWVMCLENGMVVLTQKGLETCYKGSDKITGDARLAFLMGHELAHLAKDDFWEWTAFETVQKHGSGQRAVQEILRRLTEPEDVRDQAHAREVRKTKELQADEHGLLYASMAGYDPKVIVDENGKNFFQEWVDQITGKVAYADENHPEPEHRAAFLLSHIKAVKNDLALFHIGARFCQLGIYDDALRFLEAFQKKFPCREVFSNIGLVHYQLAMTALAKFDPNRAYQYKLATVLDTETRAEAFRRGSAKEIFSKEMRKAIRNFKYACEKDISYLPARVNLSSAHMMNGEYAKAKGILETCLKLGKDDPRILNNMAIAMYLDASNPSGELSHSEKRRKALRELIAEESIERLRQVAQKHPEYPDAYYNLARMITELGHGPEAKSAWEAFLHVEPAGTFAGIARKAGKIGNAFPKKQTPRIFKETPRVSLGEFDENAQTQLKGSSKQSFDLETSSDGVSGEYYSGKGFQVLVLEEQVELVESPVRQQMGQADLISAYGPPCRVFTSVCGKKTWVYENFAMDIRDGMAVTVMHFDKNN